MSQPRTRHYQKAGRWYGDFRGYAEWGGKQEALVPDGERYATADEVRAIQVYARRLQELEDKRNGKVELDTGEEIFPTVSEYIPIHIAERIADGKLRPGESATAKQFCLDYFAEWAQNPTLDQITKRVAKEFKRHLQARKDIGNTRLLQYLSAVSSMFQYVLEEFDTQEYNPFRQISKPDRDPVTAFWLESHEGHSLLVAADQVAVDKRFGGKRSIHPMLTAGLLTGMRRKELFTRLIEDVDFNNDIITVRPNEFYTKLKTKHSEREIPLWPQLRPILREFIGTRSRLLFEGRDGNPPKQPTMSANRCYDIARIKRPPRAGPWKTLRHTYATMRLQTTEQGKPIAAWVVKEELGHSSLQMLEKTYGHMMKHRDGQRGETVEYRPRTTESAKAVGA